MNLTIPLPAEGEPVVSDEIAWRRELKQLRVRVAQLEQERGIRQAPSIDAKRSDVHGYQCGMPCPVVVDEKLPRVECATCGSKLDPVDVLRDYAHHERNFCYSLTHLRKERQDLGEEIKKLKALRQRLRADARKLLPDPPVRPGQRKWDRDQVANVMLDRVLAREPEAT